MPYDEPAATDPMQLVAQGMAAGPGAQQEMAETLVDEYVRFGYDREQLLKLFREPFFGMTHAVWRDRGDDWCVAVVDRVLARWAPAATKVRS